MLVIFSAYYRCTAEVMGLKQSKKLNMAFPRLLCLYYSRLGCCERHLELFFGNNKTHELQRVFTAGQRSVPPHLEADRY